MSIAKEKFELQSNRGMSEDSSRLSDSDVKVVCVASD